MQFLATFIFWLTFENEQKIVKNALEKMCQKRTKNGVKKKMLKNLYDHKMLIFNPKTKTT